MSLGEDTMNGKYSNDYRHLSVHSNEDRLLRLPCSHYVLAESRHGSCMVPLDLLLAFAEKFTSDEGNNEDRGGGIEKNPRGAEGGNADE